MPFPPKEHEDIDFRGDVRTLRRNHVRYGIHFLLGLQHSHFCKTRSGVMSVRNYWGSLLTSSRIVSVDL